MPKILFALAGLFLLAACGNAPENQTMSNEDSRIADTVIKDEHTLSNADAIRVKHLSLNIQVDFDQKKIKGSAHWQMEHLQPADEIIFDTYDLSIDSVMLDDGNMAAFHLDAPRPYLGSALHIPIKPHTRSLTIYYQTGDALALQWLTPEQTFGKKHPFLYTQSESIFARSWIPCQDGPGIRYTYDAIVSVPKGLIALMSATNPQRPAAEGIYHFNMDIPVPAYLMALAVGDIGFKAVDKRSGVYAEPAILNKAHAELEDIGKMIAIAEKLYGPYRWGRYDVLVLPSGFPIGGMENPRLTFATPTILAGDKSLVNLIAHELAHNWSGNLVTNATWDDFWLNEGFTVYFERRITEAMYGKDYVDMLWNLSYQDMEKAVNDLKKDGLEQDTRLKLDLNGRSADEGLTDIAYEKGAHLLLLIEQTCGREKFDTFLRQYFDSHAFQSMTTEKFLSYLDENLLKGHEDWKKAIDIDAWVYGAGIPANCPRTDASRFQRVNEQIAAFENGTKAAALTTTDWSTYEWLQFIRNLPTQMSRAQMKDLDQTFHFTQTQNSEIADIWFLQSLKHNYSEAYPAMKAFLYVTGRQKFLEPLYEEMMNTLEGSKMAMEIYVKARPNYHPLAQKNIDKILKLSK